jgi:ribosomal protein L14
MVVIDNSGALIAECVNVLKVKTKLKSSGFATVGE